MEIVSHSLSRWRSIVSLEGKVSTRFAHFFLGFSYSLTKAKPIPSSKQLLLPQGVNTFRSSIGGAPKMNVKRVDELDERRMFSQSEESSIYV